MNILIRCDASNEIGIGHLSRCQVMADNLCKHFNIFFLMIDTEFYEIHKWDSGLKLLSRKKHFKIKKDKICDTRHNWLALDVENDAKITLSICANLDCSIVIVDHYSINSSWEKTIINEEIKLLIIDDIFDRSHCELAYVMNCGSWERKNYNGWRKHEEYFCAPILNLLERKNGAKINYKYKKENKILVNFGGSDPSKLLMQTFKMITKFSSKNTHFIFCFGSYCDRGDYLKLKYLTRNRVDVSVNFDVELSSLYPILNGAIGAWGVSSLERNELNIRSFNFCYALNQRLNKKNHNLRKLNSSFTKDTLRKIIGRTIYAQNLSTRTVKHNKSFLFNRNKYDQKFKKEIKRLVATLSS